jgi:hypothetical protein
MPGRRVLGVSGVGDVEAGGLSSLEKEESPKTSYLNSSAIGSPT